MARKKTLKFISAPYLIAPDTLAVILGVQQPELPYLTRRQSLPPVDGDRNNRHYDLAVIIKYLWEKRQQTRVDVETELKKKRIIGEDIKNKIRQRQYIRKDLAEDRMVRLLNAAMNMIRYAKKKAAAMLVGCPSAQDAEAILDGKFNEALNLLKDEGKNREWSRELTDGPDMDDEDIDEKAEAEIK